MLVKAVEKTIHSICKRSPVVYKISMKKKQNTAIKDSMSATCSLTTFPEGYCVVSWAKAGIGVLACLPHAPKYDPHLLGQKTIHKVDGFFAMNRTLNKRVVIRGHSTSNLFPGIHIAQRRSYLHTLGPMVGLTYILAGTGYEQPVRTRAVDFVVTLGPDPHELQSMSWIVGPYEGWT